MSVLGYLRRSLVVGWGMAMHESSYRIIITVMPDVRRAHFVDVRELSCMYGCAYSAHAVSSPNPPKMPRPA